MPVHFRFSDTSRPILLVAAALLVVTLPLYAIEFSKTFHIDFVAFWCAGSAVLNHQNPYFDRGLHDCEISHGLLPSLTVPVPYPPYVFALFAPFGFIPFTVAFALWSCVAVAATALTGVALTRLTKLPWPFTTAATAALVLVWSLLLGQLVPLAVCALVWSLVWIREGRYTLAAGAFLAMALLPAFAIPVWAAAGVAAPQMRVRLLVAGALLLLLSALLGWPLTVMYVNAVVPAHRASEAVAFWQLGTSTLLGAAGSFALYTVGIAVGIVVGLRLRRRFGGDHWVLASAAAFGVLTSPFVHGLDVGFALPLALMLFAASRTPVAMVASLLVVVPWQFLSQNTGATAAVEIPLLVLVIGLFTGGRLAATIAAVLLIALAGIVTFRGADAANLQLAAARAVPVHASLPYDALAEVRWAAFIRGTQSTAASLYSRTPTQIALLFLAMSAIALSKPKPTADGETRP